MDSHQTKKRFLSPRLKWFGDRVHWIDISNMQLMTTTQMALWADTDMRRSLLTLFLRHRYAAPQSIRSE